MDKHLCALQSAYRSGHSTETALIKVADDIYRAMDAGALVSLDISAAFDTIDHRILCDRLKSDFNVAAMCWPGFSRTSPTDSHSFASVCLHPYDGYADVPQSSVLLGSVAVNRLSHLLEVSSILTVSTTTTTNMQMIHRSTLS